MPSFVIEKLKEQNTRYFSKAQIILNQATTVIEEPSTRAKSLGAPTTGGGGGVGGTPVTINNNTTNIENTGVDNDWIISDDYLTSLAGKKVKINNSLEINDSISEHNTIFLIQRNGETAVKVDSNKILSIGQFTQEPSTVDGGIIYLGGDFYLGL